MTKEQYLQLKEELKAGAAVVKHNKKAKKVNANLYWTRFHQLNRLKRSAVENPAALDLSNYHSLNIHAQIIKETENGTNGFIKEVSGMNSYEYRHKHIVYSVCRAAYRDHKENHESYLMEYLKRKDIREQIERPGANNLPLEYRLEKIMKQYINANKKEAVCTDA